MLFKIQIDNDGYVMSMEKSYDGQGIDIDLGGIHLGKIVCYKLVENKLVFDEEKYQSIVAEDERLERIRELTKLLADTDYIQDSFIAGLMGLTNPLTFVSDLISLIASVTKDYKTILQQRTEWINELKYLKGE